MIIMFIFLGLTVVFVIGTAIYLNKKKSQNGFTKNTSGDQGKKVDKKKLENIFNFKIKDNIICIGNRYSNIVRLGNIDYNMLSVSEQDSIENILIQTGFLHSRVRHVPAHSPVLSGFSSDSHSRLQNRSNLYPGFYDRLLWSYACCTLPYWLSPFGRPTGPLSLYSSYFPQSFAFKPIFYLRSAQTSAQTCRFITAILYYHRFFPSLQD